jgi:hypothetical protein
MSRDEEFPLCANIVLRAINQKVVFVLNSIGQLRQFALLVGLGIARVLNMGTMHLQTTQHIVTE